MHSVLLKSLVKLISGLSEMVTLDQYVCYRFGSVDCEHRAVVLERHKDLCFLSEAGVNLPVA